MSVFVAGPIIQWLGRLTTVKLGRGAQLEFQAPTPITAIPGLNFQDGDGSAIGDATASGEFDAFADFAGAASGDSTTSGDLDALADFDGVASGDSTASAGLDAFADFDGAASGDSTASAEGAGGIYLPYYRSVEQGHKRTLGRGPQEAFQAPLTLRAPAAADNFQDGAGAAEGDSTVAGALDAFGDFAGAASGDATASGGLDAFADMAGSAIGDSTASGGLDALASLDGAATGDAIASAAGTSENIQSTDGSAIGDSTASGGLDAFADMAGSAIGDSTASGALDALADLTGSVAGDSTASAGLDALADLDGTATGDAIAEAEGAQDNTQDCAGTAVGSSTCEGFIEDATPVVVAPPVADAGGAGGQVFRGAWTDRIKKPKRKKRLDDLDEMIAELRSRIEEVPVEAEDIYQRALRVSQALANQPDPSLRAIDNQIVLLRAAIEEIDDEEAILLLAA
jgi:hypothetical protein